MSVQPRAIDSEHESTEPVASPPIPTLPETSRRVADLGERERVALSLLLCPEPTPDGR